MSSLPYLWQDRWQGQSARFASSGPIRHYYDYLYSLVNPVPRTYVRGFGALPFGEVQNIHPRTHVRGVLWYGVKALLQRRA